MDKLWQDLRYGFRRLLKKPGFTAVAVLTLALGIGANTAIFSVVNAVLLRPLPYRAPEQLVRVYSEFPTMDLRKFWISPPEFFDIKNEAKSWESIGAWSIGGANVATSGEPIRVNAALVTGSLVDTLGVQPILGRNFSKEEDQKGGPPAVLISDGLWRRAFGAQTDIIGKPIQVDSRPFTVIGVMPPGYAFPPGSNDRVEVWTSFQFDPAKPGNRGNHYLSLIGRLRPGVSLAQARAEMDQLMEGWKTEKRSQHLLSSPNHPVLMSMLHEEVVGGARPGVLMLMGAVGFVLLIACVNVANLLLAQAESRHREFAVRLALGAGRGRMLMQFLSEGFILVLLGTFVGVLLAIWGLKLILAVSPDSVPRTGEIGIDLTVLVFTMVIMIIAVFLFALAPMVQIRERNLAEWLRTAGQRSVGIGGQTLRRALVIVEIALALVLVVGSGLMLRAFWKLQQVNVGFNPHGVLTFSLELPGTKYKNLDTLRFRTALEERLASLPGVVSASSADGLPPLRPINANDTDIEDYKPSSLQEPQENIDYWNNVGDSYFKTMGIRTIEGRTFELNDHAETAQKVVVVNQALARRFWKESPIGRRVSPGGEPQIWFTIVGVVEDAKNIGIDKPAGPELYFQEHQTAALQASNLINFVVRTEGNPNALASAVRSAVNEIDSSVPVYDLRPMSDMVAGSMVRPRFLSLLLATFSTIALLLAAIGIYGVMSYSVAQRTQEIGIRMALGAQKYDILQMVLRQGLVLMVTGMVIGLVVAFALTRFIASQLYEVTATDPLTYVGVVSLLAIVAILACYIPARRATKVDPMIALRYE